MMSNPEAESVMESSNEETVPEEIRSAYEVFSSNDGDDVSSGLSVRTVTPEYGNPGQQLEEDDDDTDDFSNRNRRKKQNVISDDDLDEEPELIAGNTEESIQELESPEVQLPKENDRNGSQAYCDNSVMVCEDYSSSDDIISIKKEPRQSKRQAAKRRGKKQRLTNYRDKTYEISSGDDSENAIEESEPIKKQRFDSPPPSPKDSKSRIELLDSKKLGGGEVIQHMGEAADALQRAVLAFEQLQEETEAAEKKFDPTYGMPTTDDYMDRKMGKKAQEQFEHEQSLTVERLEDLHGSLLNRPKEDQRAQDPRGLTVPLMPHQQHALAWLSWRETQNPPGGVLADDMGMGKTLTMISLIVASVAKQRANQDDSDSDSDSGSKPYAPAKKPLGGTLVVAPASLLAQWEAEVNTRCVRGLLTVQLYHGTNLKDIAKRMAKTNVVITTYNRLAREYKINGALYKIQWQRVILDEAHVIRNHKSQTCDAVCGLHANTRWALTGTPIHNKEMDLYSVLKFLRCSPFDDVRVFKRWVDNTNSAGHERLGTVLKSLMLRRMKTELQAKGELEKMTNKSVEVIRVELDQEERNVYDKVMVYSRTLFAQFLTQRAEKLRKAALGAGIYFQPAVTTSYQTTRFTEAQNKLLAQHADVKAHEILVLLLRLRQVCCHPPLIHSMLDQDDIEDAGFDDGAAGHTSLPQIDKTRVKSEMGQQEGDIGVDEKVRQHLLTSDNPVFSPKRQCSKIRAVLTKVKEILSEGDKMIIVSQWVHLLKVIAEELDSIQGATYAMFTGQVAVKDRQSILDDFNSQDSGAEILLLSLTAGGVGLNLIGANHLLLIDIHWNPQLESQAQDRIYRVGQTKNVFIYKYLCTDTVEERIQALQEKKLAIAASVLNGGGIVNTRLTLDDIRSLFNL